VGVGENTDTGTRIRGDTSGATVTLDGQYAQIRECAIRNDGGGPAVELAANFTKLIDSRMWAGGDVTVSADYTRILGCNLQTNDVTFESGTEGGIIDGCIRVGTVTDNGTNTDGDYS